MSVNETLLFVKQAAMKSVISTFSSRSISIWLFAAAKLTSEASQTSCKYNAFFVLDSTNIVPSFDGSTPEINILASSVQIRALKHIVLGFKNDISSPSTSEPKKRHLVGKDVFSQAVLDVLDKK